MQYSALDMSIAIVTDTTACIPAELVERYSIEVVPVNIIFGGRTFTDSLENDTAAFYELLRRSNDRPTTAAPSPGRYAEAIARAARRADTVVCITVSKQFSAMYDSARQAIAMLQAETPQLDARLIDSRNAAMAQGFVVIEAARAAASGESPEAVIARAEDVAKRVTLLAMLDTLSYLARSGRVPRVAAWAAGMLRVKPTVRFNAEGIRLVARTRTRTRAMDEILRQVVSHAGGGRVHLAVHHANSPDDAAELIRRLREALHVSEAYLTEFTQVMGVHTGPGLLGAAFWTE
jgi:DegV family protein with EDD domain